MKVAKICGVVLAALGLGMSAQSASAKAISIELAEAWELEPETFTCPIGGESFQQVVRHPHLVIAGLPDGSHIGDEWIDSQIPECPDNGALILPDFGATEVGSAELVYYEYTEAELARLPALLASEEWQELQQQTRTLRAYWLATQLERPVADRVRLLRHSPWGAENTAQRTTALEWLVRDLPALISELGVEDAEATLHRYAIANALRELGRFDEALALLDELDQEPVDSAPAHDPDYEHLRGGISYGLRQAIAEQDSDRYPITMLDTRMANLICSDANAADMRGPNTAEQCAKRDARMAHNQAVFKEAMALGEDDVALDASCSATAAAKRSEALSQACDFRQSDLDRDKAERMVKEEPERVADLCKDGGVSRDNGALFNACIRYQTGLESVLGNILVRDDQAFEALCDETNLPSERTEEFYLACSSAERHRAEIAALELWEDLPALRKFCAETELEGRSLAQIHACVDLEFYSEENPPDDSALEYRDGPLFSDELTRLIVPHAEALVARSLQQARASTSP